MKKSVRITYITQRVLMGIVLAISLVGAFLNDDQSVKAEYAFNVTQCVLFLIVSFLPNFLKRYRLDIPDAIYIIFVFFCMAHFFCGEILGLFVKVKWWDSLLHTFSGMMIALLSFSLINLLNKSNGGGFKLNIWFATLFAFTMTLAIGAIWEIIEFASDVLFNSNMQRAYVSTMSGRGAPLVGTEALLDTMKDLILDAIGGLAVCIVCAICVKTNKVKVEDLGIIKIKAPVDNDVAVVTNGDDAPENGEAKNVEKSDDVLSEPIHLKSDFSATDKVVIKSKRKVKNTRA